VNAVLVVHTCADRAGEEFVDAFVRSRAGVGAKAVFRDLFAFWLDLGRDVAYPTGARRYLGCCRPAIG